MARRFIVILLLSFAAALASFEGVELDAGTAEVVTIFGAFAVPAAAHPLLETLSTIFVSPFERFLAAGALGACALLLLAIGRRARKTSKGAGAAADAQSAKPASMPPLEAPDETRRRISDRGRGAVVFGLAVTGLFFGGLALWSAVAPLESAAVAPGAVSVESNRLTLDHPDGGTVDELLVREGDLVAQGQTLLRLDTTEAKAELEVLIRRRDALETLQARLLAEQANSEAVDYPDALRARAERDQQLAAMIRGQDELFQATVEAFSGEIALSEQRVEQLQDRIVGLEAQLASVKEQREIIEVESADLEELLAKGLTPQGRVLALRRERARLNGAIGRLIADIAQTKAQIGETQLGVIQLRRNRIAETSERLRSTLADLLELEPRIVATEQRLSRKDLNAPASGVVFGLTKFTLGGVIRPGEPILEIVPAETELVVEARINPSDRDVVRAGMAARVRLTAFNHQQAEPVEGELVRVSADALIDDATRERYYTGVITIPPAALSERGLKLQPGMPAEVVIPLAARTPIQYLLEPLTRNWEFALREE